MKRQIMFSTENKRKYQFVVCWISQSMLNVNLHDTQLNDDTPKDSLKHFSFTYTLIFTNLRANSADDKLTIFCLFSPENRIWDVIKTYGNKKKKKKKK